VKNGRKRERVAEGFKVSEIVLVKGRSTLYRYQVPTEACAVCFDCEACPDGKGVGPEILFAPERAEAHRRRGHEVVPVVRRG
jgi:hypothetical protein